jgi:hypothetical protein
MEGIYICHSANSSWNATFDITFVGPQKQNQERSDRVARNGVNSLLLDRAVSTRSTDEKCRNPVDVIYSHDPVAALAVLLLSTHHNV